MAAGAKVMTPLRFETLYQAEWDELETMLDEAFGRQAGRSRSRVAVQGDRLAALYRRACEHLALARARAYPVYLLQRLERLTADAHQLIYQRRALGFAVLGRFFMADFPRAVRAQARYVWVAAALLLLPTLIVGVLVYARPELILSVVSARTAESFQQMYSSSSAAVGRVPTASSSWVMFGSYISHNVGIAFQCFAGGLMLGLGSVFFLLYNGAVFGAVAGYLTERGLSATFYSFVVTHAAFELTAIVLAGAAGLRVGHALIAPGRYGRGQSLVRATRECAVIVYGLTAMLLIAAAIEAFWSSAGWLPHGLKYGVAAACWCAVFAYFALQGRHAD